MQQRILVVVDDPPVLEVLTQVLAREGFSVTQAMSGAHALDELARRPHVLALCDIRMPGMDGFELLGRIRRRHPEVDVVLTTGFGSLEGAVDAMSEGAVDYLTKPLKPREIVARLRAILERRQLEQRVNELQRELHQRHDLRNLVAESPRMRALVTAVERVAGQPEPLLLLGEPGTGRRFLARAVHFSGPRRDAPFELLDCESPPREGLDRSIFGHVSERGRPRQGQLERLAGGTLHVHQVEACPHQLQRKLARVIATGELPTGDGPPRALETRLVLSVGEPDGSLEALLADGRLVEELDCLRTLTTLELPPLRERGQDLPGLVQAFCEQYGVDHGRHLEVAPAARATLEDGDFPGNVRELFRLLRHAATMALDGELSSELLQRARRQASGAAGTGRPIAADLGDREYQLVLGAVQRNPGRLDEAARELGLSRTTLWRRMRKYDIKA